MRRIALLGAFLATALVLQAARAVPEGPEFPSPEWAAREQANYFKNGEEPQRQFSDPAFQLRLQEQNAANLADYQARQMADPSWRAPGGSAGNLCSTWQEECAGDPFLYPGVDPFYDSEGVVTPVVFYDAECARISGRVWAPKSSTPGDRLPGVVIETGSVQASEPPYWWFAQTLVRNGYVVMTFEVRGQGRSDNRTPDGTPGSNFESSVFWDGLVNVIDFFRSRPSAAYPHNVTCAGTHPTVVAPHNPFSDRIDLERLGIVGHSLGATGVSRVQGMDPWPGTLDSTNPVDVVVAWDNLSTAGGEATPRVPAMGQAGEYGLTPMPFTSPPDPDGKNGAFKAWTEAGVPAFQLTIQGSAHYEWSRIPRFPTTSWATWGNPLADHYSLAWIDRWLKRPGEPGHDTADARLLDDTTWRPRLSFYFRSARNFPTRAGVAQVCGDIRAGCPAPPPAPAPAPATPNAPPAAAGDGRLPATGGHPAADHALALGMTAALSVALRRRATI